jgi:hypothetical protein
VRCPFSSLLLILSLPFCICGGGLLLLLILAPIVLKLASQVLVVITGLPALARLPGLSEPLFVVLAQREVLDIPRAVIAEVVVVEKGFNVGSGLVGTCVEDVLIVREVRDDFLLFLW